MCRVSLSKLYMHSEHQLERKYPKKYVKPHICVKAMQQNFFLGSKKEFEPVLR
jgi:hypothetical protein